MLVVASIYQVVSIPSLLQLTRFAKPLNCSLVYFFFKSLYNVCKIVQHIFIAPTKSHTNVSWFWANFIRSLITSNVGLMHMRPKTTSVSHKNSRVGLATSIVPRSSCIFTTRDLYSASTLLARNNIDIHLVFTLHSNLFPLVSSNYASFHCSKCLLGEEEK